LGLHADDVSGLSYAMKIG